MTQKQGFISLIILSSGLVFGAGILAVNMQKKPQIGLISPLPETEIAAKNEQLGYVLGNKSRANYPPNRHFPVSLNETYSNGDLVNARCYAAMDRDTHQLLVAKNIDTEYPIASVTKIMTAITALEGTDLSLELRVSSAAASIGEASMGLSPGERVSVKDLLYGLMLPSGNDAAETLAQGLKGGRSSFMNLMNKKAHELGLLDTYFFNPSGLDESSQSTSNFSTCLDLLALTDYALENPTFAEIVSSHFKEIPYVDGKHKYFPLYNILQLDWAYPGVKGVKPGVTEFAKETLVSYAENGRKRIIVVLLGTENSRDEVIKLYDFIFGQLKIKIR